MLLRFFVAERDNHDMCMVDVYVHFLYRSKQSAKKFLFHSSMFQVLPIIFVYLLLHPILVRLCILHFNYHEEKTTATTILMHTLYQSTYLASQLCLLQFSVESLIS
ncbi:hypothetical protein RIF29_22553 [Crotalaria pallida]|uniref:Uncharacterized protein n=1 Tax=Crotalaria pallida TaxID=3830 RepID=A0AAN9FDK7_CROPI